MFSNLFRTPRNAWGRAALLMLCVVVTVAAVQMLRPATVVRADVTSEPPRDQFKAGGERSEIMLREILTVLKKMDARLEHIEKAAGDAAKTGRTSAKPATQTHRETGTP